MEKFPEEVPEKSPDAHPDNRLSRRGILGAGAAFTALVVAGGAFALLRGGNNEKPPLPPSPEYKEKPFGPEVNMLAQGETAWNMPGAKLVNNELQVRHVGREIVEQDGTEPEANTPINLFSHVEFQGDDVEVTTKLADIRESASVQFYGRPPAIYDENRFNQGALRLTVEDDTLYYDFWNGKNNEPKTGEAQIPAANDAEITMSKRGDMITVLVDGQEAFSVPEEGTFNKGKIWFGADSENPGGSARVTELKARGRVRVHTLADLPPTPKDPDGLQALATKSGSNLRIGAAISPGPLAESDREERYREIAESQFGVWTTENALKFQFVHPTPDTYCFEEAELIIKRAEACGIDVHAHALDFGDSLPKWLYKLARKDPAAIPGVLEDHIRTVLSHPALKHVKSVDVVNEPLAAIEDDDPGARLQNHLWHKAMGPAHIDRAFHTAKQVRPDMKLFLNENGCETPGPRQDFLLQTVEGLLQRGVPIDGVGLQFHVYDRKFDTVDPKHFRDIVQKLRVLGQKYGKPAGLLVRVSEIDVEGHDSAYQAGQFAGNLKVAVEEPNVIDYSQWGVTEAYGSTTTIHEDGSREIGDGLPYDTQGRPLKAIEAMKRVLRMTKRRR